MQITEKAPQNAPIGQFGSLRGIYSREAEKAPFVGARGVAIQ